MDSCKVHFLEKSQPSTNSQTFNLILATYAFRNLRSNC